MKELDELIARYPALGVCRDEIMAAYSVLEKCFAAGGKLLIAGNGGSCADAQHIAGELMKGFLLPRKCSPSFADRLIAADAADGPVLAERLQMGLPTIVLSDHAALSTAYINDVEGGGGLLYAQQLFVYGRENDVFFGISTSGNAKNVASAATVARAKGMKVVGLTGAKGGRLAGSADVTIKVPETETYKIQELHLPVYHCLCLMLESRFFGSGATGEIL